MWRTASGNCKPPGTRMPAWTNEQPPGVVMKTGATAGSVAIVGRPNVGKSALFNRLVGKGIAIVHDQPGITRDRISARSTRGARPFLVWDTGGVVGAGESELTDEVRDMVEQAIAQSDVLLCGAPGITFASGTPPFPPPSAPAGLPPENT